MNAYSNITSNPRMFCGGIVALVLAIAGPIKLIAQDQSDDQTEQADPVNTKVVFQNTTDSAVTFRVLDDSDSETIEAVDIHKEQPLPRNHQRTYDSYSGLTWEIVNRQDTVIALYVTNTRPRQFVDIKELVSWQTPVKINFQNNTDGPVDIFLTNADGTQTLVVDDMPAGTELKEQPVTSLPNQLWTIEQNDQFFADFFPGKESAQTVDLEELKTWFEPVEVTFANTTTAQQLHLFTVDVDGNEIPVTNSDNPIQSGFAHVQPGAQPLTFWKIKMGDRTIAEYHVTNEKKQVVEISDKFFE